MGGSIPHIALYVLGAGVIGVVIGWLIRGAASKRGIGRLTGEGQTRLDEVTRQRNQFATEYSKLRSTIESMQGATSNRGIGQLTGEGQTRLDEVTRQRNQFATEYSKLRSTIEYMQAAVAKGRTELESTLKKSTLLVKNVLTLRAERKATQIKVNTVQDSLISLKQQSVALQTEFDKAAKIYKGELVKSFEKRRLLEKKVEKARLEQESIHNSLESSISEYGSADKMVVAAQLRLGQLGVLERNVRKLETENAQLGDDATRSNQEYEALKQRIAELDELRIHNRQLVRYLESIGESGRKQHEDDAK